MKCAKCGAEGIKSHWVKFKNNKINVLSECFVCGQNIYLNRKAYKYNTK